MTKVRGTSTARLCWQNMGAAGIEAVERGLGFIDLSGWRKLAVTGSDAVGWLNDLVTNRVDDLGPGKARRSLLLSRTGHVRAEFHVVSTREGRVLLQDPVQPPLQPMLEPYVLSSDVTLEDRTRVLLLFVVSTATGGRTFQPFPFPGLAGLLGEQSPPDGHPVQEAELEVWRIRHGRPRFGVDLGDDALPPEAGWDDLVDRTKGCFLGQEAVAKMSSLGHPTRLIVPLRAELAPPLAEPVLSGGDVVGRVTSVAPDTDGYAVLARIAWKARDAVLHTSAGWPLARRDS